MSLDFFNILSGSGKGAVNYIAFLMLLTIILTLFFAQVVGVYAPAQINENKIEAYQITRDEYCKEWGEHYLGSGSAPKWKTMQVPPSYFLTEQGQYDDERIQNICSNPNEVKEGTFCKAKKPTDEYCMAYLGLAEGIETGSGAGARTGDETTEESSSDGSQNGPSNGQSTTQDNLDDSDSSTDYGDDILWATRNENDGYDWTACGCDGWTKCGWPYGKFEDNPPDSTLTIERFNDRYWVKSEIVNPDVASDRFTDDKCRAEAQRRGTMNCDEFYINEYTDLYYGIRLYLPADFVAARGTRGSWPWGCSLVQLKEGNGWNGGLRVRVPYETDPDKIDAENQEFKVMWRHYVHENRRWETETEYIPMIRGREFTVIFHSKATNPGIFEAWVDGKKIMEYHGDCSMNPNAESDRVNRYIQAGLYTGYYQNKKHFYFTDVVVATSFEAVQNWLEGTETSSSGGQEATMGHWNIRPDDTPHSRAEWLVVTNPNWETPASHANAKVMLNWHSISKDRGFRTSADLEYYREQFEAVGWNKFDGAMAPLGGEFRRTHIDFENTMDIEWLNNERLQGYETWKSQTGNSGKTEEQWKDEMFLRMVRGQTEFLHNKGKLSGALTSFTPSEGTRENFKTQSGAARTYDGGAAIFGQPAMDYMRDNIDVAALYLYTVDHNDLNQWTKNKIPEIDAYWSKQTKLFITTQKWYDWRDPDWTQDLINEELKLVLPLGWIITPYYHQPSESDFDVVLGYVEQWEESQ